MSWAKAFVQTLRKKRLLRDLLFRYYWSHLKTQHYSSHPKTQLFRNSGMPVLVKVPQRRLLFQNRHTL
ncbi:hypothetical protein HPB50_020964 [Hyalomma asiaticum]|uniref:Uncharacterized protein n=1 Tax=Hyalomma asiaticum TaxID=266040 RepID=A0ACB7T3S1_HYAAI|nr:hypothetical protein HPB50_020964 [Hyalomma asiaticum]